MSNSLWEHCVTDDHFLLLGYIDEHTQKELNMSKKVVGIRGLIGLLAITVAVIIAVLVGGLLLLPKITDMLTDKQQKVQQEEVVQEVVSTEKEAVKEAPDPDPNTTFSSLTNDIEVKCGSREGNGKEVALFLSSNVRCEVRLAEDATDFLATPEEEYVCLIKETFLCLTKKQYEEQKEAEAKKITQKSTTKKTSTKKPSAKKTSSNLKNEEEITVSGPATITIGSDLEAMIYIDGKKMRKSPLFKHTISPGKHTVIIVPTADPMRKHKFTIETKSGVGYIRKWSFEQGQWLKKIP